MKKFAYLIALITLLSLAGFAQPTIYKSTTLTSTVTQLEQSGSSYSSGSYSIGMDTSAGVTHNIYRTYFTFDLSSFPTGTTIDSVQVNFTNGNGGAGLTFKLTNVATISGTKSTDWAAIGNSTSLQTGVGYNAASFLSSSIKTAIQNDLSSNHIYVGALSEDESTVGSNSLMSLSFYITYKYPGALLSLTVRNDLSGGDGGNIGESIYPHSDTSYSSPHSFHAYESNRLNLAAYDGQSVGGKTWFFNDTEYPNGKSNWQEKKYNGEYTVLNTSVAFTMSPLTTEDNNATLIAFLKTTSYTTSGTLAANEEWLTNVTLSGDVTIPSGKTLTIDSGVTVNLNGHSLIISGGTISNSGTLSNLRATLTRNSASKGYFGKIQTAVNTITDDDYGNTYDLSLSNGTYSETLNISNKYGLSFYSEGSTTLNDALSITDCESCNFYGFNAESISLSGCDVPELYDINLNYGEGNQCVYVYDCTDFYFSGGEIADKYAYTNGTGFNFSESSTSDMDDYDGETVVYDNVRGIYAGSSTIDLDYADFCSNTNDLVTGSGGYIYGDYCGFSGGTAHTSGSNISLYGNQSIDCSGLSKRNGNISSIMVEGVDTLSSTFRGLDSANYALAREVRADILKSRTFDTGKYRNDYLKVVNGYTNFINKYPNSDYAKIALISTVHIYRVLHDYQGMDSFLEKIAGNDGLTSLNSLAKRFLINYYAHQKDYQNAIDIANEILPTTEGGNSTVSNDTSLICDALYAKGYIYSHDLNDKKNAVECFSSLINQYSQNSLSDLAKNELQILGESSSQASNGNAVSDSSLGYSINNYPNPFNPSTTINYTIPKTEKVTLEVYDIVGRRIAELVNTEKPAGTHSVRFDASSLASGIYFYTIRAGEFLQTKKMLLIK
jgi:tetratricopeptide (TPR) repeat protein